MRLIDDETFNFLIQCVDGLFQGAQQKSEALQAVYNDLLATPTVDELQKKYQAMLDNTYNWAIACDAFMKGVAETAKLPSTGRPPTKPPL